MKISYEVTCADVQGFLKRLSAEKITLYHLQSVNEITIRFQSDGHSQSAISDAAGKAGAEVKINRPVRLSDRIRTYGFLCVLFVLITALVFFLPTRILSVRVEGNCKIRDKYVLEQAELAGIYFGAKRASVRSERVKNSLLSRIPGLSWVGVNTNGCTAVITVKERTTAVTAGFAGTVTAKCDGIIQNISVTSGTGLCKAGDCVTTGQTLISGHGCVNGIEVVGKAEGEIAAATTHRITVIVPQPSGTDRGGAEGNSAYGVIFGKKKILFSKNSGNMQVCCGRIRIEEYAALPGGFFLPLGIYAERYGKLREQSTEDSDAWAEAYALRYIKGHMVSGTVNSYTFQKLDTEGVPTYEGVFSCTEDIGINMTEDIGQCQKQQNGL